MEVRRLFPRTREGGRELEDLCVFAARRCRTVQGHDELWEEVHGMSLAKKENFLNKVVVQDWALDVLEMGHLVIDFEGIPIWLIIELLRHRHMMRDFSLEQLSQRAIQANRLQVQVPDEFVDIVTAYMYAINERAEELGGNIKAEDIRACYPQGTLVNVVIGGNLNAWHHVFYMRSDADAGGKGGAHPQFKQLMAMTFELAREVYPIALKEILPA